MLEDESKLLLLPDKESAEMLATFGTVNVAGAMSGGVFSADYEVQPTL